MATATSGHPAVDDTILQKVLHDAIRPAMEAIGKREVAAIEQSISKPVVRDFAGRVIQRSAPGEPPRMDEDILHGIGIEQHVVTEDGAPVLYITANRPPEGEGDDPDAAAILEFGGHSNWGEVLPRPFMAPALDRMAGYAPEVIAKTLAQNLK